MVNFEFEFDIGETVSYVERVATVKSITVGSGRELYYTLEVAFPSGNLTTYQDTTVPAYQVSKYGSSS